MLEIEETQTIKQNRENKGHQKKDVKENSYIQRQK